MHRLHRIACVALSAGLALAATSTAHAQAAPQPAKPAAAPGQAAPAPGEKKPEPEAEKKPEPEAPSGGGIINTDIVAPANIPAFKDLPTLAIPKSAGERALHRVPEQKLKKPFAVTAVGIDLQFYMPSSEIKWPIPFVDDFEDVEAPTLGSLNLSLGGLHFFDHAELYMSIPLFGFSEAYTRDTQTKPQREFDMKYLVATGVKFYPLPIHVGLVRPYIAAGIARRSWTLGKASDSQVSFERADSIVIPIGLGAAWRPTPKVMVDINLQYAFADSMTVYTKVLPQALTDDAPKFDSRDVDLGALMFTLALRWTSDVTREVVTEEFRQEEAKRLSRLMRTGKASGFILALGPSMRIATNGSDYWENHRPYLESSYSEGFFPHLTAGYYHFGLDAEVRLAWRSIWGDASGYGADMETSRTGFFLEAIKLFDVGMYGFVPWVGIGVGYEMYSITDRTPQKTATGTDLHPVTSEPSGMVMSIPFGWDIRTNPSSWWFLRTSFRWVPFAEVDLPEAKGVSYDYGGLEFDVIQFVMYPSRLMK